MNNTGASARRTLLLGWNLASWELINPLLDQGQLPNLQSLVNDGVMASLRTKRPLLDQVVYNSLATGKYADKHGVFGPLEVGSDNSVRKSDSLSRHTDAVWDILSDNNIRCNVVNFPTTGPAEKINGVFVAPSFFETIPESYQQNFDISPLSVQPESQLEVLRQFIVTMEDIDAEIMSSFVPRFRELDTADPRLITIGAATAHTFSIHAVSTWLMENTSWDAMCVSYDLINFLGRDFFQYHLTNRGAINETGSEADVNRFRMSVHLFSDVVNAAIKLCDRLLGRMLELAGEDASVIVYSPWGIMGNSGIAPSDEATRTTYSESNYRGEGIFLIREPEMPSDELLHQVGFLDICPTLLRSCGVQAAEDIDGFAVQDYAEHKDNGENRPEAWAYPESTDSPSEFVQTLTRPQVLRFTEPFAEKPARSVEEGNLWTLIAVQIADDRRDEALPLLLRLYHANPLQVQRGYLIVEALQQTGHTREALALMRPLAVVFADNPVGQFMAGFVALSQGDFDLAKEMFERAEANNPPFPILFYYLGQVYLLLDLPDNAIQAFSRFLEMDPCLPHAYLGLSEALLRSQRFEEAAEAALSAVGARFSEPAMHLALGRAMAQLGEKERAAEAYETALRLAPHFDLVRDHLEWLDQYFNAAIRDPSKPSWRSLTPELHPQLGGNSRPTETVKETLLEINAWRNEFMDELETAEYQLDDHLSQKTKNLSQGDAGATDSSGRCTKEDSVAIFRNDDWVARPIEPSDQAAIKHMSFYRPFANPAEKEILVVHPTGSSQIHGAVMLQWTMSQPTILQLRLSLESSDSETDSALTQEPIQLWLLRIGLARAIAGGATQVKFAFRETEDCSILYDALKQLGFLDFKVQQIYRISSTETRDIGFSLLDRYRKKKKIPSDVRLVSLNEVPFEQANQFLKQWFADGVGDPPAEFHLPECPVMLKGDQIIACAVGYIKDDDTFVVTRIGVLPEYRKQWATPWLLGGASKVSADFGRPSLEFIIDENQYADWVKIARRHFNAQHTDTMRTMVIDLDEPVS